MTGEEKKTPGEAALAAAIPDAHGGVTVELPWAKGHTITGHPEAVRRYVESVERQRVAETQWPGDNREQMAALAELFPCFRPGSGDRLPGIVPWSSSLLVESLNTTGVANSVRHAALFLLSIWNGEDWADLGLKIRKRKKGEGHRRIGRFDLADAWSNWDHHHRAAALAWLLNPFWP